ncbi:MAG TPA: hypothetical protein VMT15_05155 [Bryobacteraceae bacterium]|nr:hypothetical protein [Bryobacteraceae bacterium]
MSCYVCSNNERIYCALEANYGSIPAITGSNRIPALKFKAKQVPEQTGRKDKTGTRTFVGLPNRIREITTFEVDTLLTDWSNTSAPPAYGPLFQCAMGGTPAIWAGGTVASVTGTTQIAFAAPHGLSVGQAVTFNDEMRFVTAIADPMTVFINGGFTTPPVAGSAMGPTINYGLANSLPSASIFDYWDPAPAAQRVVEGAAMDKMQMKVNGDFQEFTFSGPARDLVDSASFETGEGGLTQFPAEPVIANFDYTIVPGHLGEVWMGVSPAQFSTITAAELTLENNINLRAKEFGSDYARCIAASTRAVTLNFSLFAMADAQTQGLYQAARQRSPISVMLQLGQQGGQLCGAYMPAMVPQVPQFDDSDTRLQWNFQNNRAQGTANDELYVAFG